MGVLPIAAHLFILYYGTRADITPPVALAAYAGAGIAKSDPWKTGINAFQLGIAGFIIPFMFVYAPELLMIGSVWAILTSFLTAAFGIVCLAAGVQACLLVKAKWYEVVMLLAVALLMIKAGSYDRWGRFCTVCRGFHIAVVEKKARHNTNSRRIELIY